MRVQSNGRAFGARFVLAEKAKVMQAKERLQQRGEIIVAVSEIKVVFLFSVQKVWNIVTSLEKYQWRSDLSRVEVRKETQFVEYTKDGFSTIFTITVSEPYKRWEFDMENSNLCGHWSGVFTEKDGQTEIVFTENVTAKQLIMKPFVKAFLKKQQNQYVADLRRALQSCDR